MCVNYRSISLPPIISKVFEIVIFWQFCSYLTENYQLTKFQSGFRPKHSMVSALIQMCERLNNMDNGKLNGVIFLLIRKDFDSINHEILLKKMNDYFGISGMQLNWFESYIWKAENNNVLSMASIIISTYNLWSTTRFYIGPAFVSIV